MLGKQVCKFFIDEKKVNQANPLTRNLENLHIHALSRRGTTYALTLIFLQQSVVYCHLYYFKISCKTPYFHFSNSLFFYSPFGLLCSTHFFPVLYFRGALCFVAGFYVFIFYFIRFRN